MRRLLVGAVALAVVLGPATGSASRHATKGEVRAILRVVHRPAYPRRYYRIFVRISTVSSSWAAAYVVPRRGHERQVQGIVASVHRVRHRWRLHEQDDLGGCGVPRRVRRDLHLTCD